MATRCCSQVTFAIVDFLVKDGNGFGVHGNKSEIEISGGRWEKASAVHGIRVNDLAGIEAITVEECWPELWAVSLWHVDAGYRRWHVSHVPAYGWLGKGKFVEQRVDIS